MLSNTIHRGSQLVAHSHVHDGHTDDRETEHDGQRGPQFGRVHSQGMLLLDTMVHRKEINGDQRLGEQPVHEDDQKPCANTRREDDDMSITPTSSVL